jgi:hypothetical protein
MRQSDIGRRPGTVGRLAGAVRRVRRASPAPAMIARSTSIPAQPNNPMKCDQINLPETTGQGDCLWAARVDQSEETTSS